MRFRHPETGEIFTLAYNKVETTPTVTQKPDNMLSLQKQGRTESYQYVIDAKYRLEYEALEGKIIEVPKEDDINTMHRYRDAIVYKNNQQSYMRSVVGAIILFPGSQNEDYTTTRFYHSMTEVDIGGLPFLPSNTALVETFLDGLITQMINKSYKKEIIQKDSRNIDYTQIISQEGALLVAEQEEQSTLI